MLCSVRVTDLGISIGLLPSGPTGSVLDVPGVGLGHTTIWRDDPDPPAGDGVARTGVTVLDLGGNAFTSPVPAGAAILNGNGECTGMMYARECGVIETPIFLTSTMQLGRVYDAAVEILVDEEPAIGRGRRRSSRLSPSATTASCPIHAGSGSPSTTSAPRCMRRGQAPAGQPSPRARSGPAPG